MWVNQSTAEQDGRRRPSSLRQIIEFFVSLALAVSLFKVFLAESYMIETGSMAPGLYGWHRRVICPSCRYQFSLGVRPDDPDRTAVCPNCSREKIDVPSQKVSSSGAFVQDILGDRILVHKDAFAYRDPRRWEVIVFHNPHRLTDTYVKRVVGLPGERLWISDGDLYVNGKIQTKSLVTQREMRMLVYDNDFRPQRSDTGWQPRWMVQQSNQGWNSRDGSFVIDRGVLALNGDKSPLNWVVYRHWVRGGGNHTVSVKLQKWPDGLVPLDHVFWAVNYDAKSRLLSCRGTMSRELRDRLLSLHSDPAFREAVTRLYEKSHEQAITNSNSYNGPPRGREQHPVRDLAISLQLEHKSGKGEFVVQMTDGNETFRCVFDFGQRQIRLTTQDPQTPIRTTTLPARFLTQSVLLEISLMDRQVLAAADGRLLFAPWNYAAPATFSVPPSRPVRFGAHGLHLQVGAIQLFRDVYYTCTKTDAGYEPFSLGDSEYFVLGDNSSVSQDSRAWPHGPSVPILTQDRFVGKPIFVHLPSQMWHLKFGNRQQSIRIPDFSRIRYIH